LCGIKVDAGKKWVKLKIAGEKRGGEIVEKIANSLKLIFVEKTVDTCGKSCVLVTRSHVRESGKRVKFTRARKFRRAPLDGRKKMSHRGTGVKFGGARGYLMASTSGRAPPRRGWLAGGCCAVGANRGVELTEAKPASGVRTLGFAAAAAFVSSATTTRREWWAKAPQRDSLRRDGGGEPTAG